MSIVDLSTSHTSIRGYQERYFRQPVNVDRELRKTGDLYKDRDPDMQAIVNRINQLRLTAGEVAHLVYETSNHRFDIHHSTLENWISGKTRKPRNEYLRWVGLALGMERRWVKIDN